MNNRINEILNTETKKKVVSYIMRNGPSARNDIASAIGVTGATLTKISSELIDNDLLIEVGTSDENKVGRKQIFLDFNPSSFYSIGLDVTLEKTRLTILDISLEILYEYKWEYDVLTTEELKKIVIKIEEQIIKIGADKILGIGLLQQGYIKENQSLTLPIKNIQEQLEDATGLDVYMMNNIKGLAIAEDFYGCENEDFLLIKYGPGIGGVIVVEGNIVEGYKNRAGEIGHIRWNKESKSRCKICGKNGCLETEIHLRNILRGSEINKEYEIEKNKSTILKNVEVLGEASSIYIDILDPKKVIVAGEVFHDKEIFERYVDSVISNTNTISSNRIYYLNNYREKNKKAPGLIVLDYMFPKC